MTRRTYLGTGGGRGVLKYEFLRGSSRIQRAQPDPSCLEVLDAVQLSQRTGGGAVLHRATGGGFSFTRGAHCFLPQQILATHTPAPVCPAEHVSYLLPLAGNAPAVFRHIGLRKQSTKEPLEQSAASRGPQVEFITTVDMPRDALVPRLCVVAKAFGAAGAVRTKVWLRDSSKCSASIHQDYSRGWSFQGLTEKGRNNRRGCRAIGTTGLPPGESRPFSMVDFDTGEAFTVELHSGDWLVLSSELAGVNGSKWYHSSPRPPSSTDAHPFQPYWSLNVDFQFGAGSAEDVLARVLKVDAALHFRVEAGVFPPPLVNVFYVVEPLLLKGPAHELLHGDGATKRAWRSRGGTASWVGAVQIEKAWLDSVDEWEAECAEADAEGAQQPPKPIDPLLFLGAAARNRAEKRAHLSAQEEHAAEDARRTAAGEPLQPPYEDCRQLPGAAGASRDAKRAHLSAQEEHATEDARRTAAGEPLQPPYEDCRQLSGVSAANHVAKLARVKATAEYASEVAAAASASAAPPPAPVDSRGGIYSLVTQNPELSKLFLDVCHEQGITFMKKRTGDAPAKKGCFQRVISALSTHLAASKEGKAIALRFEPELADKFALQTAVGNLSSLKSALPAALVPGARERGMIEER